MKNLWKNVFRYGARFQFDDGREVTLHKRDWILLKMRDAAPDSAAPQDKEVGLLVKCFHNLDIYIMILDFGFALCCVKG